MRKRGGVNSKKQKDIELSRNKIIIGLKKAKSSIESILKEVEEGQRKEDRCFNIIQQNLAVIGLLKSVNITMLENHLDVYIAKSGRGIKQKRELKKLKDEVIKIVQTAQKK